jgi:hypothetical protein
MLVIVSAAVSVAATKEEAERCRAIEQRAERLDCFKSLRSAPRAKTESAAPAKTEDTAPAKPTSVGPGQPQHTLLIPLSSIDPNVIFTARRIGIAIGDIPARTYDVDGLSVARAPLDECYHNNIEGRLGK